MDPTRDRWMKLHEILNGNSNIWFMATDISSYFLREQIKNRNNSNFRHAIQRKLARRELGAHHVKQGTYPYLCHVVSQSMLAALGNYQLHKMQRSMPCVWYLHSKGFHHRLLYVSPNNSPPQHGEKVEMYVCNHRLLLTLFHIVVTSTEAWTSPVLITAMSPS